MTLREQHLMALAEHVMNSIYTWQMPADWGLNYGYNRDGKWEKTNTSASEVLAIIDYPQPDFDNDEEYSEEARAYARSLWHELPEFMSQLSLSMRDS